MMARVTRSIILVVCIIGILLISGCTNNNNHETNVEVTMKLQRLNECLDRDSTWEWNNNKEGECISRLDSFGCLYLYQFDVVDVFKLPDNLDLLLYLNESPIMTLFCNNHVAVENKTECWEYDGFGYYSLKNMHEKEIELCWDERGDT